MLSASLVATFVARADFVPNATTEYDIHPMSPLVNFAPVEAWTNTYDQLNVSDWEPGLVGLGAARMSAWSSEPRYNFEYIGTSVAVHIEAANMTDARPLPDAVGGISGTKLVIRPTDPRDFGVHKQDSGLRGEDYGPNARISFVRARVVMPVTAIT